MDFNALTMDNQVAIVKSTARLRRIVEKEHPVNDLNLGQGVFNGARSGEPFEPIFSRAYGPSKPSLTCPDRGEIALSPVAWLRRSSRNGSQIAKRSSAP